MVLPPFSVSITDITAINKGLMTIFYVYFGLVVVGMILVIYGVITEIQKYFKR